MKRYTLMIFMLVLLAGLGSAQAAKTYYVSAKTGNNRNDGSKGKPFKNLQKALNVAGIGDKILVAEGNYIGLMGIGYVEIVKPVSIYGGYSSDFATRDILKHRSTFICPNDKNGTSTNKATLQLKDNMPKGDIVIDGFIFDNGESNAYKSDKGRPEGCETGRICGIGEAGNVTGTQPSKFKPFINGVVPGSITVRNCAFLNGTFFGILAQIDRDGTCLIENNIFVALQMAAIEISGRNASLNANVVVRNNTILFMWTRTKSFEDMGYGVRWRSKTNLRVENNIIGTTFYGGIDIGHSVSNRNNEKLFVNNNVFFANKRGDMSLPSGGGRFLQIKAEDFPDAEQLTEADGNVTMSNPQGLKNALNKAYLQGFLSVTYSEQADNPNVNQLRSIFGLPIQAGTLNTKVSMFNNRYPREEALKLFGAMSGKGAQLPK